jgi:ATP-dependent Clp protease ATP-binding subunit ClpB
LLESGDEEKGKSINDKVMEVVKSHFRPEFLNRLDEIVIFNKLTRQNMEKIVEVQFLRLKNRLAIKNINLILDNSAKKYLSNKGYSSTYGARPLKRLIQREIENILAEKILKGEIKEADEILIKANEEHLQFASKKHIIK